MSNIVSINSVSQVHQSFGLPSTKHPLITVVKKGKIQLNIDRVFKLDEVAEAHQYMEDNKAKGKVIVRT